MNEIESKINLSLWSEEIQTKLDALRYLKDKRALLSCEMFRLINEATKDCTRALTCTADGYTFVYRWLKTATGIFLATTAQVDSYTGERKKIIGALKK